MNDKIKINLQIADSNYPLTINREEEQMVREAAKQVNIRLNKYREVYKNLEPEKIIAMVAYQFSLEKLQLMQQATATAHTVIPLLTEFCTTPRIRGNVSMIPGSVRGVPFLHNILAVSKHSLQKSQGILPLIASNMSTPVSVVQEKFSLLWMSWRSASPQGQTWRGKCFHRS